MNNSLRSIALYGFINDKSKIRESINNTNMQYFLLNEAGDPIKKVFEKAVDNIKELGKISAGFKQTSALIKNAQKTLTKHYSKPDDEKAQAMLSLSDIFLSAFGKLMLGLKDSLGKRELEGRNGDTLKKITDDEIKEIISSYFVPSKYTTSNIKNAYEYVKEKMSEGEIDEGFGDWLSKTWDKVSNFVLKSVTDGSGTSEKLRQLLDGDIRKALISDLNNMKLSDFALYFRTNKSFLNKLTKSGNTSRAISPGSGSGGGSPEASGSGSPRSRSPDRRGSDSDRPASTTRSAAGRPGTASSAPSTRSSDGEERTTPASADTKPETSPSRSERSSSTSASDSAGGGAASTASEVPELSVDKEKLRPLVDKLKGVIDDEDKLKQFLFDLVDNNKDKPEVLDILGIKENKLFRRLIESVQHCRLSILAEGTEEENLEKAIQAIKAAAKKHGIKYDVVRKIITKLIDAKHRKKKTKSEREKTETSPADGSDGSAKSTSSAPESKTKDGEEGGDTHAKPEAKDDPPEETSSKKMDLKKIFKDAGSDDETAKSNSKKVKDSLKKALEDLTITLDLEQDVKEKVAEPILQNIINPIIQNAQKDIDNKIVIENWIRLAGL